MINAEQSGTPDPGPRMTHTHTNREVQFTQSQLKYACAVHKSSVG